MNTVASIRVYNFTYNDYYLLSTHDKSRQILHDLGVYNDDISEFINIDEGFFKYDYNIFPYNFEERMNSMFTNYIKMLVGVRNNKTGNITYFTRFFTKSIKYDCTFSCDFYQDDTYIDYETIDYVAEIHCMVDYFVEKFGELSDHDFWSHQYLQKGTYILLAMCAESVPSPDTFNV